jgi:tripartite-type tricarboxylate transporter receptor subunit TctC
MLLSVVGGQTLFVFADSGITVPLAKSGKVRSFAVANPTRIAELPDVPTMPEAGLGDVDIKPQWNGAFLAAGTPPAIVSKLEAELRKVIADPGVRDKIRAMTYYPEGMPSAEFRARIDGDIKSFSDVVKAANLKFER